MLVSKFANVNGVRLHYVEDGEGPLVIMIHGFPDFWFTWRHQIHAIAAAGFHVVAIDSRGYNLSDKPMGIESYDIETLCKDVEQLIYHFKTDKAFVIGHDWGGNISWYFSMLYPELVERLVIINIPHPQRMMEGLKTFRQLRKSWYMFFFQLPWFPEAFIRANHYKLIRNLFVSDLVKPLTPNEVNTYVQAISKPGALTSAINYYRAVFKKTLSKQQDLWRKINAPVLVLWGDKDKYLGSELAEPNSEWVTNATVEHFPNASHWIHLDEPKSVNERIIAFFR